MSEGNVLQLTKFQESMLFIGAMKNVLENDLRVFKRYLHDDDLKFAMNNKMLIEICSFLEEWKRFKKYAKDDEGVRATMKITAPAIKRLKSWRGLEGWRNTMLAHGPRDDNDGGKVTLLDKRYFDAEVPTTYCEVMLLAEYCVYVIAAFICRHKADHIVALGSIKKSDNNVVRGIQTQAEFNLAVKELQEHMFALDPELKERFDV
jgi:hypothetical protein